MGKIDLLKHIKHELIASCQALPDEPLHGPEMMARMALARVCQQTKTNM